MNYRASFCDPFKKDIIEIGDVDKDKVMETFEKIPWFEFLEKMDNAGENEIYYSPSLEIENKDNKNGLSVSIVDKSEWYIFYKRPKLVKKFFGLSEKMDPDYLTDITGQTEKDVRDCLNALLKNDLEFLENKIK